MSRNSFNQVPGFPKVYPPVCVPESNRPRKTLGSRVFSATHRNPRYCVVADHMRLKWYLQHGLKDLDSNDPMMTFFTGTDGGTWKKVFWWCSRCPYISWNSLRKYVGKMKTSKFWKQSLEKTFLIIDKNAAKNMNSSHFGRIEENKIRSVI